MEENTSWAKDAFVLEFFIILENANNFLKLPLDIFLAGKIIEGNTSSFFSRYEFGPERITCLTIRIQLVSKGHKKTHSHNGDVFNVYPLSYFYTGININYTLRCSRRHRLK